MDNSSNPAVNATDRFKQGMNIQHRESRGRLQVMSQSSGTAPKPVHSMDDVDFSKSNSKIEILDSHALGEGKKRIFMFEMKVKVGDVVWKVARSEKEFGEFHTKLVAKKNKTIAFPDNLFGKGKKTISKADSANLSLSSSSSDRSAKKRRSVGFFTAPKPKEKKGLDNKYEPPLSPGRRTTTATSECPPPDDAPPPLPVIGRVEVPDEPAPDISISTGCESAPPSPITSRPGAHQDRNMQFQQYCDEVTGNEEIVSSPIFTDFLDPTVNPCGWFMSRVSELRASFQVNKDKDVYCICYGGQIFVFKNLTTADTCLYSVDLSCADIDLAAQQEPGITTFEICEEKSKKKLWRFSSRVDSHAREWIEQCRKARLKDVTPGKDLLKYAERIGVDEAPADESQLFRQMQRSVSRYTPSRIRKAALMFDNQTTVSHDPGEFALTRDSETNIKFGENGEITAASLPKLFEKLVFGEIDKWTFAYTFHLFAKPKQLLDQLQFRFLHPVKRSKDSQDQEQRADEATQRMAIIKFLLLWTKDDFWIDFAEDVELVTSAIKFCKDALVTVPSARDTLSLILVQIEEKESRAGQVGQKVATNFEPSILPRYFGPNTFELFDINPTEIARQLALKSHELWLKISVREFLYCNSKQQEKKARNVLKFIENFNHVSRWTASYVLMGCTPQQRGFFIMQMIDTTVKSLKLDNFHVSVAMLSSLEGSPISRLKQSWAFVDPKLKEALAEVKQVFVTSSNWKTYREKLQSSTFPCVPYLGLFLQDLTFINDGNKDTLEPHDLVNWHKCRLLAGVISELQKTKQGVYRFHVVPEIQEYIEKFPVWDEKEQWKLSQTVEPREKVKPT